jgi:RNA polymerase sigma-70 factor (ECF subfamily)
LRWAAWARRPRHNGSDREPLFEGRHGSPAASLNFSLSKKNGWLCDMFGCDGSGDPLLLSFIKRSNPDLKRPDEPVGLALHQPGLPPDCIKVFLDGAPCEEADRLDRLAESIERQWDGPVEVPVAAPVPAGGDGAASNGRVHTGSATGMRVKLKLDRDFEQYVRNQDEKRRLMRMIWDGLKCASAREVSIRKGCVELTLELNPEEAERLLWAARGGELDEFGLLEIEGVEGAPAAEAAGRDGPYLVAAHSPARPEPPGPLGPAPPRGAEPQPATSLSLLNSLRDPQASGWQRFWELYVPLVRHWCRRSRLQPADADDLVQEIFLRVYDQLTRFRPARPQAGSFRAWLRTVTLFVIADHRRHRLSQPRAVPDRQMQGPLDDAALASCQTDDEAEERRILYRRALELLRPQVSPPAWRAFTQTLIEGRPAAEVAAELGVSVNQVRVLSYRTRQKLRHLLEGLLA